MNDLFLFDTQINTFSLAFEWHLLETENRINLLLYRQKFSPFVYLGADIFFMDPNADFSKNKDLDIIESIQNDQEASKDGVHGAMLFGVGMDFNASRKVSMGISLGIRPTFTDYLDGISMAADPASIDLYSTATIRIGYKFAKKDQDKDGVADILDQCITKAGPQELNGCPDTDGDGILDISDHCPEVFGSLLYAGCPDTDNDGIADINDKCPNEKGIRSLAGCPEPDQDKDGIIDKEDNCPTEVGIPELSGCPSYDFDEDGILDKEDRCPRQFGLSIFEGCPDDDGDGIQDSEDACPEKFGVYNNFGCPFFMNTTEEINSINNHPIFFNVGTSEIDSYVNLDRLIKFMKNNLSSSLDIKGFSGNEGDKEFNQNLSLRRAKKCYDYLVNKGVESNRIRYFGMGTLIPQQSPSTEETRRKNRRVEFFVSLQ